VNGRKFWAANFYYSTARSTELDVDVIHLVKQADTDASSLDEFQIDSPL
jgi:hypothetical protein